MKRYGYKKSFALVFTIVLMVVFSLYSLTIMENNTIASNLNKLKYLHLQATIHISYIENYIKNNIDDDIEVLELNDNRFDMDISKIVDNNITKYYVSVKTVDDTPIGLSKEIIK